MTEKKNVVTQFPSLETCEIEDGDNSMFESEVINGFVLRAALFAAIEEKKQRNGVPHPSSIIEA